MDALIRNVLRNAKESPMRAMLALASEPGMISLAGGHPDPNLLPRDWLVEMAHVELGAKVLQRGDQGDLGDSRISSVLGLKVRPRTLTVLPRSVPPNTDATLRAIARLRFSLTASTASTMRIGASWSCAVLINARVSFGKHDPPKPGPA